MPELAEVETVRRQLDRHLRGQIIRDVELDSTDRILFKHAEPELVRRALKGARVTGTGRKGKYFWLELDRKPWPLFHLGMSGGATLLLPKRPRTAGMWEGVKLWSNANDDVSERRWFCRLVLIFQNGVEFGFRDPRRFGRVWLTDDPLEHPRVSALGFDPLKDFPRAKALAEILRKRRQAIKSVLLDQSLFAGVGNYLADEILYQARLAPARRACDLEMAEMTRLRNKVVGVVARAVELNADYARFPTDWLFHHRWGKNQRAKTSRGQQIVFDTIGGRTAAWVPSRQK